MVVELSPPWLDLEFMSPLSGERAARLVRFLAAGEPALVLDLGCGWAELLLRTVAAVPSCRGIGVDRGADAIAHGRALAASRGLAGRVDLIAGDASLEAKVPAGGAGALICVGASQIWATADDEEAAGPLDYRAALIALRGLVARGGRVVYGDATWSTPPTPEATAALSGRADEFVALATLVEIAVSCGFAPMACHEASREEWDEFESGYSACYARWLAAHDPEHPEADDVRQRALRQRLAYLAGYRGVMGLGYLQLLAV